MLTEHQILIFWVQLLVLLAAARGLGELMRRIGQPPVLGELTAGLLLGPSVLGHLAPELSAWLFPPDPVQKAALAAVAWLGVLLLLVVTGFETDLGLVRRLARRTAPVMLGSLLLPAATGIGVGLSLPQAFVGERADRLIFALFMATALGISALPVIASVLSQLGLMRRSIAQMTLAAATLDDIAGWMLLGIVAGLAQSGSVDIERLLITVVGLGIFMVGALTVGQRVVDALLRWAREQRSGPGGAFTITVLVALFAGVITHSMGLEAVFGAFIAGTVLGRSKFQEESTFNALERVSGSLLSPIFFATAGLRVDLGLLANPEVAIWGVIVLIAASLSKFTGAYLGGWFAGLPPRERFALGAGLNARGAVEIVVATVGLSLGVLNGSSYAIVVLLAMATSMAAPILLRLSLRNWEGSPEERDRLERERLLGGNVLVRPMRVLLPSHGGPNSVLAARIVDLTWPREAEVTILSAGGDVPREDLARVRAAFANRSVVHEHDSASQPLEAILKHSALGYGAIAVGATDLRVAGRLVSPVIDDLLGASPLPVVMVRAGAREDLSQPPRYRRILVPAIGTAPGRAALEMACNVARRTGAELLLAHVVTSPPRATLGGEVPRSEVVEQVVASARAYAAELNVNAEPIIRAGLSAAEELLALVRERQVDLLVVAANLRQLSGMPFLGHGVEDLLEEAECTTVVVTAPPGWVR
jgi:Kef-type K+ transport system membrane component KefB